MEERERTVLNGWFMLIVTILTWLVLAAAIGRWARLHPAPTVWQVVGLVLFALFAVYLSAGFFTLQPNQARVLVLFGKYVGTVRKAGFHWANSFTVCRLPSIVVTVQPEKQPSAPRLKNKYVISLRARNFETTAVKVNDQRGNPIEIAAVVVWRVEDTARALFDVDEYEHYVRIQSETAVRHLANSYPYDHSEDSPGAEMTLRGDVDSVTVPLVKELSARLSRAGVMVEEARLTHLAYAPEIAGAMLRRQQAEAIIAARKKIVHGAVSMVQMALTELSEKKVVELDEERKAAMVGNLLVVLCGEKQAEPVINAGTLYH